MPYSTCCGIYSYMPEIDICPECKEHCDWDDGDSGDDDIFNNSFTEGGVSIKKNDEWQGR